MRISDWSSDVCSSDLRVWLERGMGRVRLQRLRRALRRHPQLPQYERLVLGGVVEALQAAGFAAVAGQIGRASCRERVCQYVSISVVAVSLKKKKTSTIITLI